MPKRTQSRAIDLGHGSTTPLDVLARWPADVPVVMLHSGRWHEHWARWSIMASPRCWLRIDARGRSAWVGDVPRALANLQFAHDPLRDVQAAFDATWVGLHSGADSIPFRGGWIGYFAYELGSVIEPAARWTAARDNSAPLLELAYCPDALVFDHLHCRWHSIGNPPRVDLSANDNVFDFSCGELTPEIDPDQYMSMVARARHYIAAGDIFQANIAQRFTAEFHGSTRGLALAAFHNAQPWYGAYIEIPQAPLEIQNPKAPPRRNVDEIQNRSLLSLSPELFLQFSPHTRTVTTRPIKGTRPAARPLHELLHSAKDAAELHMIVDLMRNDLGRVCEYGSISVVKPREIETHPTIHHGVGEVTGRLRTGSNFTDLLRAAFPGGSVTGAPKIRAMQIIEELESPHFPRGPYCGAIGFIGNSGDVSLNIAIRTIELNTNKDARRPGLLTYAAGAGIVADSDPSSEYRESLDKTAALRAVMQAHPSAGLSLAASQA